MDNTNNNIKKSKNGKPPVHIDINKVKQLASHGLNLEQIANCLGLGRRQFINRKNDCEELQRAWEQGKSKGVAEIANSLFEKAKKGDTTAQIFFLKCHGAWNDKTTVELETKQPIQITFKNDLKD